MQNKTLTTKTTTTTTMMIGLQKKRELKLGLNSKLDIYKLTSSIGHDMDNLCT